MPEYYNLPVLFTEEERSRYAQWGLKKEKMLKPMMLVSAVVYFVVVAVAVRFVLRNLDGLSVATMHMLSWGIIIIAMASTAGQVLGLLVAKPLDMILDRIYGKPKDPRMLRLEPSQVGVHYQLSQEKKILCKGVLSWQQWQTAVIPGANEIWIEGQRLKIGANTIENIYSAEHRGKYLDHPAEKIVGTLDLGKIQKNLEGYLASLEERKREMEWLARNPQ